MKKVELIFTSFFLFWSLAVADGEKYSSESIGGTYGCQITAFAWPQRREDPLMPNSQGASEVVANGAGKLTEGTMDLHSVEEANEGIPCKYDLRKTKSGARTYNVVYDQTGITISVCDRR